MLVERYSSLKSEKLSERAAGFVPVLRARASEAERQRQVPKESVADLAAAGLCGILQPRSFGGDEQDFEVFVKVVAEIARGCGSTGWFFSLSNVCRWILALFPPAAQKEVWENNPSASIQAAIAPSAAAEKVEGGYRITGTWNYTSGCDHADWMFVGALVPDGSAGRPLPGFLLLPREDFRVEDNWHTVGLCGTGSKNIIVDGAFVPERRVAGFAALSSGSAPGTALHSNPVYRIPLMTVIPMALAAPALGIAQDGLDEFLELARGRKTKGAVAGAGSKMADFAQIQSRVAEASGLIDAARLLLLRDADDVVAAVASGAQVDIDRRIRNRRDHALAVRFCVNAVDGLYAATGASGLFLENRLQRCWRDINAIAKHIGVNWDAVSTMCGQHALGLEPRGQY